MTETTPKTKVDWDSLVQLYADGASDVEIAKELGVTIAKFYRLYEENPNFAEFVENGRSLAHAWWLTQSRKGLWNRSFNTSLFNFVMKNRYGWADKVENTDTTGKDDIDLDHVKGQISAAMKKLAETNPELFRGVNLLGTPIEKDAND